MKKLLLSCLAMTVAGVAMSQQPAKKQAPKEEKPTVKFAPPVVKQDKAPAKEKEVKFAPPKVTKTETAPPPPPPPPPPKEPKKKD